LADFILFLCLILNFDAIEKHAAISKGEIKLGVFLKQYSIKLPELPECWCSKQRVDLRLSVQDYMLNYCCVHLLQLVDGQSSTKVLEK